MLDNRTITDIDLLAFDQCWYRNYNGKILHVTFEIICHDLLQYGRAGAGGRATIWS